MSSHEQTAAFLNEQRWFAGKGRTYSVTAIDEIARLDQVVRIELVEVTYASGEPSTELYQMPISVYSEPQDRISHALVRHDQDWVYDALHDRDAMAVIYRTFSAGVAADDAGDLQVHRVIAPDLSSDVHSTFLPAEQSNSSAVFGETAILKVFRKVHAGHNPDIEIHRALTEAGDSHVAHLYGWISSGDRDLAMLQQYLRTASDGWELAKNSVRNLLSEADLHADEVGGDFGAEAHRLGAALAAVHGVLRGAFPTAPLDTAELAAAMRSRLEAAVEVVPELAELAPDLHARFDEVAGLDPIATAPHAHRVHGDLHLGQTLRTSLGWKLVDFEGEPARPLAERQLPDSGWRDVAGMIRSFHYAAAATLRDVELAGDEGAQAAYRAEEWVEHNANAFLSGYIDERGEPISDEERILLAAFTADKAVYEAAYEARNRPTWLDIPLAGLAGLTRVP